MLRLLRARFCCAEPTVFETNDKQSVPEVRATNKSSHEEWKLNLSFLGSPTLQRTLLGPGAESTAASRQLRQLVREVALGDYIGAGGSGGKVFKAKWRDSTVAVKLMVSSDLDQLRITTREALLSRSLSHPHLVQTYAVHVSQLEEEDLDPLTYAPQVAGHGAAGDEDDVDGLLATALLTTCGTVADEAQPQPWPQSSVAEYSPVANKSNKNKNGSFNSCMAANVADAAIEAPGSSRWVDITPPPFSCQAGRSSPHSRASSFLKRGVVSEQGSRYDRSYTRSLDERQQPASIPIKIAQPQLWQRCPPAEAQLCPLPSGSTSPPLSGTPASASARSSSVHPALADSGASALPAGSGGSRPGGTRAASSPSRRGPPCEAFPTLSMGLRPNEEAGAGAAHSATVGVQSLPHPAHHRQPGHRQPPPQEADAPASSHNGTSPEGIDTMSRTLVQPNSNASRFLRELSAMGAAAGRYVTCVVMEYCERGNLLELIEKRACVDKDMCRNRRRSLLPQISSSRNAFRTPLRSAQSGSMDGSGRHGGGDCGIGGDGGNSGGGNGATSSGLSSLELLRNALEVAQAMSYLHSLDLVHGDLKPANVLLRVHFDDPAGDAADSVESCPAGGPQQQRLAGVRGYCCKVADFGHTALASQSEALRRTATGCSWGSIAYLAPEVVANSTHGKPADVYSYGALLWQMVTGLPPHGQLHPAQILVGLAGGELSLEWPQGAERTLRKIGEACLSQDPTARPTFDQVVRALVKAVGRTTVRHRACAAAATATTAASPAAKKQAGLQEAGATGRHDGSGGSVPHLDVWQPLDTAPCISPGESRPESGAPGTSSSSVKNNSLRPQEAPTPQAQGSRAPHVWRGFYVGSEGCAAPSPPSEAEAFFSVCLSGPQTAAARWVSTEELTAFSFSGRRGNRRSSTTAARQAQDERVRSQV